MKKFFALLLIIALFAGYAGTSAAEPDQSDTGDLIVLKSTGEMVVRVQLRLRELGYFNFKPTGNFANMSQKSTIKFQQLQQDASGTSIMADGTIGQQTSDILFSPQAKRAPIEASIPFGRTSDKKPEKTGKLTPWSEVRQVLKTDESYAITDYYTGSTWKMVFMGGENHAEMECASAADAAVYKETFGNEYNYSKRPVLVMINGTNTAASLQGFPHGADSVSGNDMDGHSCLFFDGSLSHVNSLPDVEHINHIYTAAGR
jgi:peptidoglycan hydrolase-like protein with peptidoglycan-binding domain